MLICSLADIAIENEEIAEKRNAVIEVVRIDKMFVFIIVLAYRFLSEVNEIEIEVREVEFTGTKENGRSNNAEPIAVARFGGFRGSHKQIELPHTQSKCALAVHMKIQFRFSSLQEIENFIPVNQ